MQSTGKEKDGDELKWPLLSKFRVLIVRDIAMFAWPIFVFTMQEKRLRTGIILVMALIAGQTTARAKRSLEILSRRQMRMRAVITVLGFSLWIAGIIWGAINGHSAALWAVLSVFIPVLCVIAYASVRVSLVQLYLRGLFQATWRSCTTWSPALFRSQLASLQYRRPKGRLV